MLEKKDLRKQVIAIRDKLTAAEVEYNSALIAKNLYSLPEYEAAKVIMFFISFGSEVNTRFMVEETIRRDKKALAPKSLPKSREMIASQILDWNADLVPGYYNIPEPRSDRLRPVDPKKIDLLIVPGVAFDLKGNRLGYGGGYYDRFFNLLKQDTPLIALVFDLQIQEQVPVEEWDRPVDLIITEKRIIRAH